MHKHYIKSKFHYRYTSQYRGRSAGYAESSYKPFSRNIKKFGSYRTQAQRFYGYANMPKKAYRANIYGGAKVETELSRIARFDANAARRALARQLGRGARQLGVLAVKKIARSMIFKALMTGNDLYMIYELVTESYKGLHYAIQRDFAYWDRLRTGAKDLHLNNSDHDWMQEAATGPKPKRWRYQYTDGTHEGQWYTHDPNEDELENYGHFARGEKGHWGEKPNGWEKSEWILDKEKHHHFIGWEAYKRLHGRN